MAVPAATDFTVTVLSLMLTVATLVLLEDTLKVPVFPLTVNVVLFG